MAAIRYVAMFRVAAVVFLLFGGAWIWRFGFTDYAPQYRPAGLAAGVLAVVVAVFLWRTSKLAIAASAVTAASIGICAAVAAPAMHGPVILAFAALAIALVVYAVLAARVLFDRTT